jgi:hypothetical protein
MIGNRDGFGGHREEGPYGAVGPASVQPDAPSCRPSPRRSRKLPLLLLVLGPFY